MKIRINSPSITYRRNFCVTTRSMIFSKASGSPSGMRVKGTRAIKNPQRKRHKKWCCLALASIMLNLASATNVRVTGGFLWLHVRLTQSTIFLSSSLNLAYEQSILLYDSFYLEVKSLEKYPWFNFSDQKDLETSRYVWTPKLLRLK